MPSPSSLFPLSPSFPSSTNNLALALFLVIDSDILSLTGDRLAGLLPMPQSPFGSEEEAHGEAEEAAEGDSDEGQPEGASDHASEGESPEESLLDELGLGRDPQLLRSLMQALAGGSLRPRDLSKAPKKERALQSLDIHGVADYIKEKEPRNVLVACGAGVSVSAGIPDFRTPGTGLYDNLGDYDLPNPQSMFEIGFFESNPGPFWDLAKHLYPGYFHPTPAHCFMKLLHDKGMLRRVYTQNVDALERKAGVPRWKIVTAHGSFERTHCIGPDRHKVPDEKVMQGIRQGEPVYCDECGAVAKPDITFFGEALPPDFFNFAEEDFPICDLLIILGTRFAKKKKKKIIPRGSSLSLVFFGNVKVARASFGSLEVQPFAGIVARVPESCPRLLINRYWHDVKWNNLRQSCAPSLGSASGVNDRMNAAGRKWGRATPAT